MLGHKTGLNEFKNTEIISSIFSTMTGKQKSIKRKKLENSQLCDIKQNAAKQ